LGEDPMRNTLWMWILTSTAVVLIGSYGVTSYMARNPATKSMPPQGLEVPFVIEGVKDGNPLLSADKAAVSRWFPGNCFAEIYVRDPSFGGKLIPGCIQQVAQQIKAETGVSLAEADIRSTDALTHFKQVYGVDNPWRD
jgi:hypothetical protein